MTRPVAHLPDATRRKSGGPVPTPILENKSPNHGHFAADFTHVIYFIMNLPIMKDRELEYRASYHRPPVAIRRFKFGEVVSS